MKHASPFDAGFLTRLETLRLHARQRFTGQVPGERRSPRHGASLELVDFRPYAAGDDLRQIDWNVYARLDRMFVKLFSEERDLCVHLLVDTSASMQFGAPSKLDCGLRAAAALGYIALCNHERVAFGLFSDRLHQVVRPRRGRRQIYPLMRLLAEVESGGTTDIGDCLARYAWQVSAPGLAIVISDFLDGERGYEPGLRALHSRGFEVQVLHVLADEEMDPPIDGDVLLEDYEQREGAPAKALTAGARTLAHHREQLTQFCDGVEQFCTRRRMAYLRVSSGVPLDELVLRRLRERRFLI